MSIKCLNNITHNGVKYLKNDLISDITKLEAERLIKLHAAIKIDHKFKRSKQGYKKMLENKYRKNRLSEMEGSYGF